MASGILMQSYKTVADTHWGYCKVELDKKRRFNDAMMDLPWKYKCIDDTPL